MIDLQTLGLDAFRQNAGEASRLLKALSNEHRLMILCRLGDKEVQVSRLQEEIGLSQSALSQHLARLRDEGLVASRREGVSIYYRIADPAAVRVIAVLAEIYCPPDN